VERGEEVVITRRDKPVARLLALRSRSPPVAPWVSWQGTGPAGQVIDFPTSNPGPDEEIERDFTNATEPAGTGSRILLDTNALPRACWIEPERLTSKAAKAYLAATELHFSVISAWEIALNAFPRRIPGLASAYGLGRIH